MTPFIQVSGDQSTIEHWKRILHENTMESFAAFAYVTDSGAAQVATYLKNYIGNARRCRWVFGFDYGRSHPTAIRKISQLGQSEIRIHDGDFVVQSHSFVPRKSFHLKTAATLLETGYPCKQLIGSGNLSASGLLSGLEAGCIIDYASVDPAVGTRVISDLEQIWENATPVQNVIEEYEQKYTSISLPKIVTNDTANIIVSSLFWIDVGYVTKNRGDDKPGNQFDLPRGSHIHLGIQEIQNPVLNSILGELRIRTPGGAIIERNIRYGNNSMEKLTLPIPEQYGYQCYDGKILTFEVADDEVLLQSFEHDDFFRIYGVHITSCNEMQSGRRYGTISLNNE